MEIGDKPRLKTFVSMDSLWYEEERLATFIDWPVPFISYRDLAHEGFYYLRTQDHCACAFCRGIIGSWEEGDTPRGEHKRHFPNCPFVQGKVTPNVPLTQGSILARVSREIKGGVNKLPSSSIGEDVCGIRKDRDKFESCPEDRILSKSMNTEISMASLGFRQYCGPKRKEYLTTEVRLNSFKHWPEKVKQTPKELADAGFYYCGLSDHVRCFHCGNGLRNWEPDDNPWEEHARWFPDCHFVLLQKGIAFVDKVRRERPPYISTKLRGSSSTNGRMPSTASSTQNSTSLNLSDEETDKLMELEILNHVLDMGFSRHVVRIALRQHVMETGQPFFSVDVCIDAILRVMEEETKNTIHGCEDITSQARKMAEMERRHRSSTVGEVVSIGGSGGRLFLGAPSTRNVNTQSDVAVPNSGAQLYPPLPNNNAVTTNSTVAVSSTHSDVAVPNSTAPLCPPSTNNDDVPTNSLPTLPNNNTTTSPTTELAPLPNIARASPPLRASTPTTQIEDSFSPQAMDVEEEETTPIEAEGEDVPPMAREAAPNNVSAMELPNEVAPLISEADIIMEEAAKLLAPPRSNCSSSQSSSVSSSPSSTASCSSSSSQISSTSSGISSASSQSSSASSTTSSASSITSSASSDQSSASSSHSSFHSSDEFGIELKEPSVGSVACGTVASPDDGNENLALELERMRENRMCKVCMDKEMDVVFLPCTHMVTCSSCAVALAACPICRRDIQIAFRPIIS